MFFQGYLNPFELFCSLLSTETPSCHCLTLHPYSSVCCNFSLITSLKFVATKLLDFEGISLPWYNAENYKHKAALIFKSRSCLLPFIGDLGEMGEQTLFVWVLPAWSFWLMPILSVNSHSSFRYGVNEALLPFSCGKRATELCLMSQVRHLNLYCMAEACAGHVCKCMHAKVKICVWLDPLHTVMAAMSELWPPPRTNRAIVAVAVRQSSMRQ